MHWPDRRWTAVTVVPTVMVMNWWGELVEVSFIA